MGDEHVGADDAIPPDHRFAAQDGGAGVDGHVVLDGGVALFAPQALAAPGGQGTQGHALVELDVVADDRGLAHHNAGAVVDEEILADGCPGVDINAGDAVGMLRHHARQHGHPQGIQHMRHAVNRNGEQAGVAEHDFIGAVGGGVAVVEGLHVRLAHRADFGDFPEKLQADLLRPLLRRVLVQLLPQHHGDLLVEVVHHVLNEHGEVIAGIVHPVAFIPGRAGVGDAQELMDDVRHRLLVRVDEGVELVDVPPVAVILQNAVYNALDLLFNGRHGLPPSECIGAEHPPLLPA